jgi:hypothetical protein
VGDDDRPGEQDLGEVPREGPRRGALPRLTIGKARDRAEVSPAKPRGRPSRSKARRIRKGAARA